MAFSFSTTLGTQSSRYENSRHDYYFRDEPRAVTTDCIYPCVRMKIQLEVRGQDVARVVIGSM